jgi:hypothetical protein
MIVGAALAILYEAYAGFLVPKPIEAAWTGLVVSTAATAFTQQSVI